MNYKELLNTKETMDSIQVDKLATGRNIKFLCEKNGMSLQTLSEYLGFTCSQALYNWYEGKSSPSIDNMLKLSFIFNTPVENIIVCK